MNKNAKLLFLPLITALALLAAFVLTSPVYAQDEVPPEVPPEGVPEEVPLEEVLEEPAPIGETLAETGVEVVDASGEPVPLVEELAIVDPWFKVGTVKYEFTTADCDPGPGVTACANPLQAAVNYISANGKIPSDGYIHVDAGTLNNQEVYIDGSDPYIPSLKGIAGHVDPATYTPDAILGFTAGWGSSINVTNKMNGFALTGLQIIGDATGYGVVDFNNSAGSILLQDLVVYSDYANGAAIFIRNHNGSITLKNVDSSDNAGAGAYLNNSAGTSGVTITNSSFNNNNSWNSATWPTGGLSIFTRGSVSLTGVTAYGNAGGQPGLFIQQSGTIAIKNSVFSENDGAGFSNWYDLATADPAANITLTNVSMDGNGFNEFYTKGAISFTGVSASGNTDWTYIDTCNEDGGVCEWAGSGAVTIKNSTFVGNGSPDYGLYVIGRGAITLTSVSASRNTSGTNNPGGAYLDNSYSQIAAPVKVTTGWFDGNDFTGLFIYSKGVVTLSKISASNNASGGYGVYVVNTFGATPSVSVSGASTAYNQFNDNGLDGLYIASKGAISVKYSNAINNLDDGFTLYNDFGSATAGVSVTNCNLISNGGDNLYLYSYGAIKISYLEANQSDTGSGAILNNRFSSSSPGVTVSNANFWDNFATGLYVESKGNIILTNTAAWDNGGAASANGAYLNNSAGTGYIKITNPKSTDIDMFAGFDNNEARGLDLYTNGTVTLTNVNMIGNVEQGMYAGLGIRPSGVTLTNCRVDDNDDAGIIISTIGPVVISGGHANNNFGWGVRVNNSYADDALPKPVTIKNFTASGNLQHGIYVTSKGAIALSSVTVNDTVGADDAAILLENNVAGALIPSVTLSKVYASNNIYNGVYILSNGAVKYSTGESSHNGRIGVYVNTLGSITLSNVISTWNSYHGAELLNNGSTTHAAISVSGSTSTPGFSNNGGYGIRMQSMGAVTVKNILLNNNTNWGLYANNYQSGNGIGNFTVSNVTANDTTGDGFYITSNGIVTLSSVISMFNTDDGVYVNSNDNKVVVSNSVMIANAGNGIDATIGTGTFTMSNTLYFGNDTDNSGDPNILVVP